MSGIAHKLIGKQFGNLTVKYKTFNKILSGRTHAMWACSCVCGGTKVASTGDLNAGNTTSCGCLWKGKAKRPYESTYNNLVYNAKSKNKYINLTYEEFLEFIKIKNCHYCGKSIVWQEHLNSKILRYNIDRKDNNEGYTACNCIVCCPECNLTKGNRFSYNEFMILSDGLRLIQKTRKLNEIHTRA